MSRKTDTVIARTIGIDTGKNTLHLIGLDDRGAIVLREKLTRGRIAARLANVPQCLIGCRSRCQQAIGRSLGASASAAIATCARCSCRALELFCSDRQTGQSTALDRGSRPRRNGCIIMFWQLRSRISWRGSLGRSWRNGATMNRAL